MRSVTSKAAAARYWRNIYRSMVGKRRVSPVYFNKKIQVSDEFNKFINSCGLDKFKRMNELNPHPKLTKSGNKLQIEWESTIGNVIITLKTTQEGVTLHKYRSSVLIYKLLKSTYNDDISEFLLDLMIDGETTLEKVVEDNAITAFTLVALSAIVLGTIFLHT